MFPWLSQLPSLPKSKQVNDQGQCVGDICQFNNRLYAVWCTRLKPTDPHFVYFDIQKRIVWIDCGCHSHANSNNSNKIHIKHNDCRRNIKNLLCHSLIGFLKYNSLEEMKTFFDDHYIFDDSEFIDNQLYCENCKILLCSELPKFISKYIYSSSFTNMKDAEFSNIFFIYIISKLLSYCLLNANTAFFIVSNHCKTLLCFAAFALLKLQIFHQNTSNNDKHDAILFRIVFDALTEFIQLLIKHSRKFGNSWWNIQSVQDDDVINRFNTANAVFLSIQHIINYFINNNKFRNTFKNSYVMSNQTVHKRLILPLIIFLHLFRKCYVIKVNLWINTQLRNPSTNQQKWLYNQLKSICYLYEQNMDIYEYLKQNQIYSPYVRITEKKLKWSNVKCQWRKCKRRKIDLIKRNARYDWKKCKGCKIVRYCSRKCQKLDWKNGVHKDLCKLFNAL